MMCGMKRKFIKESDMCVPLSSPLLLEFYKAWMEDHSSMHRENVGLCICLMDYLATTMSKKKPTQEDIEHFKMVRSKTLEEMKLQFTCAGLSSFLPFNDDLLCYEDEGKKHSCHTNPERLQWVKDRIADSCKGV